MVIQTREQHIRRESATSNICTNQALCALTAAVYLSTIGEHGLKQISTSIAVNSNFAAKTISNIKGVNAPHFKAPLFQDFTVDLGFDENESTKFFQLLAEDGFLGGLPLQTYYPELKGIHLFSATEVHSKNDIERLAEALEGRMR